MVGDAQASKFEQVQHVAVAVVTTRSVPSRLREDAIQEAHLAVWEACCQPGLTEERAYRIADNAVIVFLRRERRWEHRHQLGEVDAKSAPSYTIEDELLARSAIRELSSADQALLRAVFTHGNERDAAQELGLSRSVLNRKRSEARRKIPT